MVFNANANANAKASISLKRPRDDSMTNDVSNINQSHCRPTLYQTQNNRIGTICDQVYTYDPSKDKRDASKRLSTTIPPDSNVCVSSFYDDCIDHNQNQPVPTMAPPRLQSTTTIQPPNQPTGSKLTSNRVTQMSSSSSSSALMNPYLKSTGTSHSSSVTLSSSHHNNPYRKSPTTMLSKTLPINPYIKSQKIAPNTTQTFYDRSNFQTQNSCCQSPSTGLNNLQKTVVNEAPSHPAIKNNPYLSRKAASYDTKSSNHFSTTMTLQQSGNDTAIPVLGCSNSSLDAASVTQQPILPQIKPSPIPTSIVQSLEIDHSSSIAPNSYPSMTSLRPKSWTAIHPSSDQSIPSPNDSAQPTQSATANRPEIPGEALLPPELVYDPESIKPIKDEYRSKLTIHARLDKPLLNGWILYRHQKRAILKGLMKRRVILALDMGLGKTLIGCVWARAFKESYHGLKIFVVCPVTLKKEWKRTAEEATGIVVEEEKRVSNDSLDMTIATWAKIPTTVDPAIDKFVVVFDEAHAMQSMESNRTQSALKLVFDKRCVGVLLLTGTPMKNGKPCNLFPLLKAVRHPLGRHQRAYESHFCQGRMASLGGRMQWIANGQANLKQLHRMIESNLLHMTKDEYLNELPPMKRETRTVPINARFQKQYNEKVKSMASLKEAMKTNVELSTNALMGATQELRVICSFAKIGATVEIAKEVLQIEPAVVIFTNFAKAATSIHRQLEDCGWKGALLTGETPAKKRQDLVDGFQQELYSVFVATFGAGGVGITLTQARTIIFLDRPWTPGDLLQAEDRIRRIGQEKDTRSVWVSAFEFDSQLDAMLEEKNQAAKAVLTKTGISTGDSSATINISKLVASIIASNPVMRS